MARPKTVLSEDKQHLAEQMMKKDASKSSIASALRVSHHTIDKLFPEYRRAFKSAKKLENPKKTRGYKPPHIPEKIKSTKFITPLYDPARHGPLVYPSLTAKLCGDPPPGRREMLEQWRQKSNKQCDLSEEA